ncbi:unnamed protein product [Calicophoron daubneyi]|uniref:Uncharacterized protein n=1 Tax=Calicophoron daubneyi TaxID=300641 RepID=A0AAV2TUG2_CALDB
MQVIFLKPAVISGILCIMFLVSLLVRNPETKRRPDPQLFRYHPIFTDLITLRSRYKLQPDEVAFPLAFSLQIYTDIDLAVRLLRAIYRPHNTYCIHVDKKSLPGYFSTMQKAAELIGENVFLVPNESRFFVEWGGLSTLEADIMCSRLLLAKSRTWKYWINLTGHEFPLRTNWELVTALKAMNHTNIVIGSLNPREPWRTPPPTLTKFKVRWSKGTAHVAVRREFVEYVNKNPRATELLEALRKWESARRALTFSDELYFSTLNHNPSVFPIPGAYLGPEGSELKNPPILRHKIWHFDRRPCGSWEWQRQICIFGVDDVPALKSSVYFFANKFVADFQPEAYDQMEQWLEFKVNYEAINNHFHESFRPEIYSELEIASNHL